MRHGLTLTELAAEVDRQATAKKDFVASQVAVEFRPEIRKQEEEEEPEVVTPASLQIEGQGNFPVTQHCQDQLCDRTPMGRRYWRHMEDGHQGLLATNINYWLRQEPEKRMLVRTLDGQARAWLTNRYRILDNYDLMMALLPIFQEQAGRYQVVSSNIGENHMFVKLVTTEIQFNVGTHIFHKADNPRMYPCLSIGNSETGEGSLRIEPAFVCSWCENLAIMTTAFKRHHVGRGLGTDSAEVMELLSDETRRKDDDAFFSKVRDVVKGSFDELEFEKRAQQWITAQSDEIPEDKEPVALVEELANQHNLTEVEQNGVLANLLKDSHQTGMNRFALANAVTTVANSDEGSYERTTELERLGGQIIEMQPNAWRELVAVPA